MAWRRKTSEHVGETQLKKHTITRTWMRLQRGRWRKRGKM